MTTQIDMLTSMYKQYCIDNKLDLRIDAEQQLADLPFTSGHKAFLESFCYIWDIAQAQDDKNTPLTFSEFANSAHYDAEQANFDFPITSYTVVFFDGSLFIHQPHNSTYWHVLIENTEETFINFNEAVEYLYHNYYIGGIYPKQSATFEDLNLVYCIWMMKNSTTEYRNAFYGNDKTLAELKTAICNYMDNHYNIQEFDDQPDWDTLEIIR